MKRLICSILFSIIVVQSHDVSGQIIDWVPFGADFEYLFTLKDEGQGWQAFDPTYDENFYSEFVTGIGGDALWSTTDYDTSVPVGAVRPDLSGATTLDWRTGTSPIRYGTINYLNNNGINGTNLGAAVDAGGLGFDEAAADGEKWTHYFRTEFEVTETATQVFAEVVVDDGAIFYIDGQEVGVWNCCDADPRRQELIDAGIPESELRQYELNGISTGGAQTENQINTPDLNLGAFGGTLTPGTHVLGVEVHQGNRTSSDMSMYVRLFTSTEDNQWGLQGGGDWERTTSWTLGIPNSVGATANFWGLATGPATVAHDEGSLTLGAVSFDNSQFVIAGTSTLTFESAGVNSTVDALQGDHEFQIAVSLANDTDVTAAAGSSIEFNNTLSLNGNTLTTNGDVQFNNRVIANGGALAAVAGAISGDAEIDGDLLNQGATVSPGSGLGLLTVNGDFIQSDDGILQIEIGGLDPVGQYDVLDVKGNLVLAGTLDVDLVDGFMPTVGDEFDILDFGSLSGGMNVDLPELSAGLAWDISNLGAAGSIAVLPEPASILLLVLGSMLFAMRRRG